MSGYVSSNDDFSKTDSHGIQPLKCLIHIRQHRFCQHVWLDYSFKDGYQWHIGGLGLYIM